VIMSDSFKRRMARLCATYDGAVIWAPNTSICGGDAKLFARIDNAALSSSDLPIIQIHCRVSMVFARPWASIVSRSTLEYGIGRFPMLSNPHDTRSQGPRLIF